MLPTATGQNLPSRSKRLLPAGDTILRQLGLTLCAASVLCYAPITLMISLLNLCLSLLISIPASDFPLVLASVYGGLLAVVVPLSYSLIYQVSERYKSDVVSRNFAQTRLVRFFPLVLIVGLIFAVASIFFGAAALGSWLQLAWFMFSCRWLWLYLMLILRYMDSHHLLADLLDSKQSSFENTNQLAFNRSIEGIGDVLVYETSRHQTEVVEAGTKQLRDSALHLIDLWQTRKDDFEKLAISDEYKELRRDNEFAASAWVTLTPDKVTTGFSTIVHQLARIATVAATNQDVRLTMSVTARLFSILEHLAIQPVDSVITVLQDVVFNVLRQWFFLYCEKKDSLMGEALARWYRYSVLNYGDFHYAWVNRFNSKLLAHFQIAILHGDKKTFTALIENLLNQHSWWPDSEYWALRKLAPNEDAESTGALESLRKLMESDLCTTTFEKFKNWHDEARKSLTVLEHKLDGEAESKFREATQSLLRRCTQTFVGFQLRSTLFAVGSYCLFKGAHDYIKFMWTVEQPGDSNTDWGDIDLFPMTGTDLMRIYFGTDPEVRSWESTWEGRHSSLPYEREYFVLMLGHLMVLAKRQQNKHLQKFSAAVNLSIMSRKQRNTLQRYAGPLAELSKKLSSRTPKLGELGFSETEATEIFAEAVPSLLDSLIPEIEALERIEIINAPISEALRDEFLGEILTAHRSVTLFGLFDHFGKLRSSTSVSQRAREIGMQARLPKDLFIDNWHTASVGMATEIGRRLVSMENGVICDRLIENCESANVSDFQGALNAATTTVDHIILAGPLALNVITENFVFDYHYDAAGSSDFSPLGFCKAGSINVPVFQTGLASLNNSAALIDVRRLGYLVQYTPLAEADTVAGGTTIKVAPFTPAQIEAALAKKNLSDEEAEKERQEFELDVDVILARRIRYVRRKRWIGSVFEFGP